MAECKKVVITGIPGSGSTQFCARYISANLDRLRIHEYNMGDMLLEVAQSDSQKPPVLAENLLNLNPAYLESLRRRVFDWTLTKIEKDKQSLDRLLIDMHCQFFWNDIFTNANDWSNLICLEPDIFVTLIEKPSTIITNQLATPQGRSQNHGLRDISLWQNFEVNTAQGFAANFGVPHYIMPGRQDPLTVESLLRSAFLIYFQMPMTDASSQADAEITEFKERLIDVGRQLKGFPTPLIDPRTIDIESGDGLSAQDELAIRRHTVHRDLNWYIAQASDLVAFYPIGTTLSKGVSDESTRGFETGKNVFVIYPNKHTSPFMDIATRVFSSTDEFFDFWPEYMQERITKLRRI